MEIVDSCKFKRKTFDWKIRTKFAIILRKRMKALDTNVHDRVNRLGLGHHI